MASVEMECICPKCRNREATSEYYTRSGREIVFCSRCGFFKESFDCDDEGRPKVIGGYGSYRITYVSGVSRVGSFVRRRTLEHRQLKLRRVCNNKAVSKVAITVRERGKWRNKVLFDRNLHCRGRSRAAFKFPVPVRTGACVPPQGYHEDDDLPF